jgi:hypothetical protein
MKSPKTLNTKCIYNFLRFLIDIGVSHADKLDNAYGHEKTVGGKNFDGNLETDEDRRRFGLRTEPRYQFERKEDPCNYSQSDSMRKPERGMLEL